MIKIAICDDDKTMAHEIENHIHQMPFNGVETDVFLSGGELLHHAIIGEQYNIVLLDIEMPSVNGITTALKLRQLDSNIILIFVTAYKEYVYQIFEALPFRFLEKPVSYKSLLEVITDALHYVDDIKSYFFFKKGTTNHQMPSNKIIYFEADNRKIKINTSSGTDIYYGIFKRLMDQLNPNYFMQIHTSYIVNMDYVTSFNDKGVLLSDGSYLPVSLKYREHARLEHLKFIERRCGKW